jgi:hypothetical protein
MYCDKLLLIMDMENDFMKRGYLLPNGCNDLADALKLKQFHQPRLRVMQHLAPPPPPPIVGELVIPEQTSVLDLAKLLGQEPLKIIADVMQLGGYVSVDQILDFKTISGVARKYGFIARRTEAS